ncbi:MAG: CoA-binding protein [Candidatus Odinarchaeia archaeon]
MEDLVRSFLDIKNIFAVVGVSRDPSKYGHRIYFTLRRLGYKVYAVNPNLDIVNGDRVYHSLSELPEKPDVVDIVVRPSVGLKVVQEAKELGISNIWLQPGAESDEIIDFCKTNNMVVVYGLCVMIEASVSKNGDR